MRSLRAKLASAFVVTVGIVGCKEAEAPPPVAPVVNHTPDNPPGPDPQPANVPTADDIVNDKTAHILFRRQQDGTCVVLRTSGPVEGRRAAPTPCPPAMLAQPLVACLDAALSRFEGKDDCTCTHFANPPYVQKVPCTASDTTKP